MQNMILLSLITGVIFGTGMIPVDLDYRFPESVVACKNGLQNTPRSGKYHADHCCKISSHIFQGFADGRNDCDNAKVFITDDSLSNTFTSILLVDHQTIKMPVDKG